MAVCRKTFGQLLVGTLSLIGIIVGSVFTVIGVNSRDSKQSENVTDEVYLSIGSLFTIGVSAVVVGMLLYKNEITMSQVVLVIGVFLSCVLELYTINYITSSPTDAVIYIVVVIGFLFRVVTLMVGYGRCEIPDILTTTP